LNSVPAASDDELCEGLDTMDVKPLTIEFLSSTKGFIPLKISRPEEEVL
jgi:hypothetical protein